MWGECLTQFTKGRDILKKVVLFKNHAAVIDRMSNNFYIRGKLRYYFMTSKNYEDVSENFASYSLVILSCTI